MTTLLQRAVAEIQKLPPQDQDAIAARLLAEVDDERQWDHASPRRPTTSGIASSRRCAVMSPKGARSHSTKSSHPTSHSGELGHHRGIPSPARSAPRLGAPSKRPAPTLYGESIRTTRACSSSG